MFIAFCCCPKMPNSKHKARRPPATTATSRPAQHARQGASSCAWLHLNAFGRLLAFNDVLLASGKGLPKPADTSPDIGLHGSADSGGRASAMAGLGSSLRCCMASPATKSFKKGGVSPPLPPPRQLQLSSADDVLDLLPAGQDKTEGPPLTSTVSWRACSR